MHDYEKLASISQMTGLSSSVLSTLLVSRIFLSAVSGDAKDLGHPFVQNRGLQTTRLLHLENAFLIVFSLIKRIMGFELRIAQLQTKKECHRLTITPSLAKRKRYSLVILRI